MISTVAKPVSSLVEDRKGRVWFGTWGDGIGCWEDGRVKRLHQQDGLCFDDVNGFAEDGLGRLWIATDRGVSVLQDGAFLPGIPKAFAPLNVKSVASDSGGRIYLGAIGRTMVVQPDLSYIELTVETGLPQKTVQAAFADSHGRVWFGTWGGGIVQFDTRTLSITRDLALPDAGLVCAFCEDGEGRIIAASGSHGLWRLDGERWNRLPLPAGVEDIRVVAEIAASLAEGRIKVASPSAVRKPQPAAATQTLVCAFCGKAAVQVQFLVKGPSHCICNGCVTALRRLPLNLAALASGAKVADRVRCSFCSRELPSALVAMPSKGGATICGRCLERFETALRQKAAAVGGLTPETRAPVRPPKAATSPKPAPPQPSQPEAPPPATETEGTIDVTCPKCSSTYSLGPKYWDRNVECPQCDAKFYVASRKNQGVPPETEEFAAGSDWADGQAILGDFVVERLLGQGGMGRVYLVRNQSGGSRFAVKRAIGLSGPERQNFLSELQVWIDLPEHPNMVPCRFFRTLGTEVVIFADYVEGGSLEHWIESRKLYGGDAAKALERMLDMAIQFAWGLHCVHELGVVHQDVKPGNVLVSENGGSPGSGFRVQVTDYGLARARAAAGERHVPKPGQDVLVSSGGCTPAYCSPEQARGDRLTRHTDIWSWGVSVLEMFTGEVTWLTGQVADSVLQQHFADENGPAGIPRMPDGVSRVLARCFREKAAERWATLADAVEELKIVYRNTVGREYGRPLGRVDQQPVDQVGIKERRGRSGGDWRDPREWLQKALRAEGGDSAEALAIADRHGATRRGQLVTEIAVYDEARQIYERLVQAGRKELEHDLAILCAEAAYLHQTADDSSGALALYNRAINDLDRLVNRENRRELVDDLARTYVNKANMVRDLGDKREAVELYDRAIDTFNQMIRGLNGVKVLDQLAAAYANKGAAVSDLGDAPGAVGLYDLAIDMYERLVNRAGRGDLANHLADTYMNKANALSALADKRGAVEVCGRAVEIYERLINKENRHEFDDELASAYMNKSIALAGLGEHREAGTLFDRAIDIYERLVDQEGRRELADGLAKAYMNKGASLTDSGDKRGAAAMCDRAIHIYERLVEQEGRRELADGLALSLLNKARALRSLNDGRTACALFDRAIEIYEQLVTREGRRELTHYLTTACINKSDELNDLGEHRGVGTLCDRVIELCSKLKDREERCRLGEHFARTCAEKADALRKVHLSGSAVCLYHRAIRLFESLVNKEGRSEYAHILATTYINAACLSQSVGGSRAAVRLCDQGIKMFDKLVNDKKAERNWAVVGQLGFARVLYSEVLETLGDRQGAERELREAVVVLRAEFARTQQADLMEGLRFAEQKLGHFR
ncbi:MAG TPA: protein kinase [Verrucomicrobiae bacterium]|nr:protein kinase [Verrucomicrobiae bacterium]